jgi:hypothetical protein
MVRAGQSPKGPLLLLLVVTAAAAAASGARGAAAAAAAAEGGAALALPVVVPPPRRARPTALGALPLAVGSRVGAPNPDDTTTPTSAAATTPALPTSVCGASDLRPSSAAAVCQLVSSWRLVDKGLATDDDALSTGIESWTCSAFRVGPRALATAGHCVFTKNSNYTTQYADSIEVYCGSATKTCASSDGGRPSARGARALASPRWVSGNATLPSPFDWAVIETTRVISGGGGTLRLSAAARGGAQPGAPVGARKAKLSGFPNFTPAGEVGGGGTCASAAFEDGCKQFSSAGTIQTGLVDPRAPGFFVSSALDLCPGQSGGPVVDGSTGEVLAVVSGFSTDRCLNLFAAHAPEGEVDPSTCERAAGGASVPCLWTRLTGEKLRSSSSSGRG